MKPTRLEVIEDIRDNFELRESTDTKMLAQTQATPAHEKALLRALIKDQDSRLGRHGPAADPLALALNKRAAERQK